MYRFISIFCFLLSCGQILSAQHLITLQVQDPSKENLPHVYVSVFKEEDTSKAISNSITDLNGLVQFSVSTFPVIIKASSIGYEPYIGRLTSASNSTVIIRLPQKINSLTEIIVTGVGRPTKLDEAVSVYKIISAADIRSQGAVTLQDALNNQLGINVGYDAMTGGTIKMQGMSGDNVKILIDGLPVTGREGQNIDLSTLNLNNIEKIEITQGPMSIMYGADALGGVINLITRDNNKTLKAAANFFYETTGKYNAGIDLAHTIKKHNIAIGGGRNFFQGWDPEDKEKRNPLWRPKEQYFGNLKYTYRFSNDAFLTFGSDYMNDLLIIKGGTETYSFYNRHVRDDYFTTQRWMNRLQMKWKSGKNGYWESNNSFSYYNKSRRSYFTDLSTMMQNPSAFDGDQSTTTFHNYTFRTTYNNKVGILNYTFGYDINLESTVGTDKIKDGKKHIGDYALLLITDFNILPELKLQPALRSSLNTQYPTPIVPSFSILYKPSKDMQIRGSYARGFRAPTLKELYLDFKDSNHDIYGNEDLNAEDGHHFQLSTGYTVYQKGNNYNTVSLTGYFNDVHNQISLAQSGNAVIPGTPNPYTYINIGHFKNLQLQLISQNQYQQFYIALGGSFNHAIKTTTSLEYNYWEANTNFRYSFPEYKGSIALFYKYTGAAPLIITDVTGGAAMEEGLFSDVYHNLDASLEKSFWNDRLHIVIGARNLFNNTIIGSSGTSTNPLANSPHGGNTQTGGINLSTGRSFFTSVKLQLGR